MIVKFKGDSFYKPCEFIDNVLYYNGERVQKYTVEDIFFSSEEVVKMKNKIREETSNEIAGFDLNTTRIELRKEIAVALINSNVSVAHIEEHTTRIVDTILGKRDTDEKI